VLSFTFSGHRVAAGDEVLNGRKLLLHQQQMSKAVHDNDLLINYAPTGTGKTLSALLAIKSAGQKKVLFIAPTNALVEQHARDVRDFVKANGLEHTVEAVSSESSFWREQDGRFCHKLADYMQKHVAKSLIFVTNPDIFYYMLHAVTGIVDRRDLDIGIQTILKEFDTVVVDEFHYYSSRQMMSFIYNLLMWREMGFFAEGNFKRRKMIWLSATPPQFLQAVLQEFASSGVRIFQTSDEMAAGEWCNSLSPIEINFLERQTHSIKFLSQLQEITPQIKEWLNQNQQGVVISNEKWVIDSYYEYLKSEGMGEHVGRITGTISVKERESAANKNLILATPTVDIGFNFTRSDEKERQNIDFVVFDASAEDSFWQRIGRAGRVLGKKVQNFPAKAIAFVPGKVIRRLEKLETEQKTDDRFRLKSVLKEVWSVSERDGGAKGLFLWDISLSISDMASKSGEEGKERLQDVFQKLVWILRGSESGLKLDSLRGFSRRYRDLNQLKDILNSPDNFMQKRKRIKEDVFLQRALDRIEGFYEKYLGVSPSKKQLIYFAQERLNLYKCLQNFRGSGFGEIDVYDYSGVLSETGKKKNISVLDVLKYDIRTNRQTENVEVLGVREKKIPQCWVWQWSEDNLFSEFKEEPERFLQEFNQKYEGKIRCIKNLTIDTKAVAVPEECLAKIKNAWIPIFFPGENDIILETGYLRPVKVDIGTGDPRKAYLSSACFEYFEVFWSNFYI
jgi:CRISPR-associated helicase Cas3